MEMMNSMTMTESLQLVFSCKACQHVDRLNITNLYGQIELLKRIHGVDLARHNMQRGCYIGTIRDYSTSSKSLKTETRNFIIILTRMAIDLIRVPEVVL